MIIKRKYELISILCKNDASAKKIILDAISEGRNGDEIQQIFDSIQNSYLYLADDDYCIRNIDVMMNNIEQLDKKAPYDNGLTYRDVKKVIPFPSRKGNALELWLINSELERQDRIVQIIAIENINNKMSFVETWDEHFQI